MFIDPVKGDFRVREESLALKLGFKNFPMDRFGVKKTSLKAIARTPEIPPMQAETKKRGPATGEWLGARLQELGSGAFSAAARAGLVTGDLLLQINGNRVEKFGQVQRLTDQFDTQPLTLKIVRDQTPRTITFQP